MRETRRQGNYPCQTILHTLKFQDVLESNIMITGIAIVKSTANKTFVHVCVISFDEIIRQARILLLRLYGLGYSY